MTRMSDPTFDQRIADWLEDDPMWAPAEVLNTVLAALPSVDRRAPWRLPWSLPPIFGSRPALGALLIVVALLAGAYGLAGLTGVGTGGPRPATTSPSPATASPSAPTIGSADVNRVLPGGSYRMADFAAPFDVTLPAGWQAMEVSRNNVVLRQTNTYLTLVNMDAVYADPCHPDASATPIQPGADSLLAALGSMAGATVTDIRDATVGGASGKAFTMITSVDAAAEHCSNPSSLSIGTYQRNGTAVDVLIGPSETNALWVVDAPGARVLIGGPDEVIASLSFVDAVPG
jgi:hypothetical protein